MKSTSISERLILYLVTVAMIIIVIIGSITYLITKQALINRTFDQLITLRLEKSSRLETFFHDRESDLKRWSDETSTKQIAQISLEQKLQQPDSLFPTNHPEYYSGLWICLPQRSFVHIEGGNRAPDISSEALEKMINRVSDTNNVAYADLSSQQINLYMLTRIQGSNACVIMEIPQSAINAIMVSKSKDSGLGQTGESYLVGADFLMRSNSRFKENVTLLQSVKNESVINAMNGLSGKAFVRDYRNVSCLSSYSPILQNRLNWIILAEMDEQEAMIPVDSIRNSILLISVIISAAIFLFAIFAAQKIVIPLKRLQKASEQIGGGNFDIRLKVSSSDEIGVLTKTFNWMTNQLNEQKLELESEKTKRFSSLIDGQEMERRRLSRDLHDGLGQSLLAVNLKLEQASHQHNNTNNQLLVETQVLLLKTINEIRQITANLLPPVLEVFGLEQACLTLCKETSAQSTTLFVFQSQDIPENINEKIQVYIYRIAQEAINNIVKHAKASHADMTMYAYENDLYVGFVDNGNGFDSHNPSIKGNGLLNIRQRVELLHGDCRIHSSSESGTRINIKIPLQE